MNGNENKPDQSGTLKDSIKVNKEYTCRKEKNLDRQVYFRLVPYQAGILFIISEKSDVMPIGIVMFCGAAAK